jgi:hypothetical protein
LLFQTDASNRLEAENRRLQAEFAAAAARHNEAYQLLRQRLLFHTEARHQAIVELKEATAAHAQLKRDQEELLTKFHERDQELATLNAQASEWQQFRQSRSYRVISKYYSLYGVPAFARLLRPARRVAGHGLGLLRRLGGPRSRR